LRHKAFHTRKLTFWIISISEVDLKDIKFSQKIPQEQGTITHSIQKPEGPSHSSIRMRFNKSVICLRKESKKGEGDAQWLAPESLCFEMGYDINKKRTFQRAIIEETEFRRCTACRKSWTDPQNKPRRREFARKTFEIFDIPIRFMWDMVLKAEYTFIESQAKGDMPIMCNEPTPRNKKMKRGFMPRAAAGYDFNLQELVFYDVESNKNGKVTQQVYRDVILEPIMKPWLQAGQLFWLEEDRDSGHGPKDNNNIIRQWK
jgi:hypothetical protein